MRPPTKIDWVLLRISSGLILSGSFYYGLGGLLIGLGIFLAMTVLFNLAEENVDP